MGQSQSFTAIVEEYEKLNIPCDCVLNIPCSLLEKFREKEKDGAHLRGIEISHINGTAWEKHIFSLVERSMQKWPASAAPRNNLTFTLKIVYGLILLFIIFVLVWFPQNIPQIDLSTNSYPLLILVLIFILTWSLFFPKQPKFKVEKIRCFLNPKIIEEHNTFCHRRSWLQKILYRRKCSHKLLFHGTTLTNHEGIMENNFKDQWTIIERLFKKLDDGWFGNGIYLTSNVFYAQHYIQFRGGHERTGYHLPGKNRTVHVVGAWTIVGKTFEVRDLSLKGKPCQPGYNSHHVLVTCRKGNKQANVIEFYPTKKGERPHADEWVFFKKDQIVPMFIISLKRIR